MRYALIIAGGSGTRLWPMSREDKPKQLLPLFAGQSLLELSAQRVSSLIPPENLCICAAQSHQHAIAQAVPQLGAQRFYGEPCGRDTLNAVGLVAAVLVKDDPEATIAVFTADHLIEPVDVFRDVVTRGFELAEASPQTLVTFGIAPTHAATGYGYLELGQRINEHALTVTQFREKPKSDDAQKYFESGPDAFLWNSGMFVWKARTLLSAIQKFAPDNYSALTELAQKWDTPQRDAELARVYPQLPRISVDFAVMEPASKDADFNVAALPMKLSWLDVGSWPAFAQTRTPDADGNVCSAASALLKDTHNTLVLSNDDQHLIATLGCEDLIIVHTDDATLICHKDAAENLKQLQQQIAQQFKGRHT